MTALIVKNLKEATLPFLAPVVYKAYGVDVFKRYKWLKATCNWTVEERLRWRLQRLQRIVSFAWENVPFYKEFWGDHGLNQRPLNCIEDLQGYPVLSKDVFRANANKMRPLNFPALRTVKWTTGGTTGQPVSYYRDLDQWVLNEAFHLWGWEQMGYHFGEPVAVLAGGSLVPERMTIKGTLRGILQNRLFLYGVSMNQEIAREYRERIMEFGARYIYGYPSIICLFANHLSEQGLKLDGIKAIVTTAEMLFPNYRAGIESYFGCPVFNNLGCNDGGYESYECFRHEGLHYNDLQSVLEVGQAGTDFEGHLLITNLWNFGTPFVRYENGDLIELTNVSCPCGAVFPKVASIQGRTSDILVFANGTSVAGPALTLIFRDMDIDGWQIEQTGPDSLLVRIKSRKEIPEHYTNHILRTLNHHINAEGHSVRVDIIRVDSLGVTKGGKLKPIIRNEAIAKA